MEDFTEQLTPRVRIPIGGGDGDGGVGGVYVTRLSCVWDARIRYKGKLIGTQLGANNFLIYDTDASLARDRSTVGRWVHSPAMSQEDTNRSATLNCKIRLRIIVSQSEGEKTKVRATYLLLSFF